MSEFDTKATDWDKDLIHTKRSEAIAKELLTMIPVNATMRALEFGAGTGLLSFILKDKLSEIIMIDTSKEMIRVAQEKIVEGNNQNMKALCIDLEKDQFDDQFDLIYNQMVFHHVENIEPIVKKFYTLLKPGGYLAIADLYTEDGSFHGHDFNGHKGFDVDQLASIIEKQNFINIQHKECFIIKRVDGNKKSTDYPVFLLTAMRK
jgi:ubiquinone/menaquinone biosynthesis C-methylase UbiE